MSQHPSKAPAHPSGEPAPKRGYGQGRQTLLDAAARLVAREGPAYLTLRDLAKEAGMSHNAIYRHFDGVEDMLLTLLRDFNQRLREGLRQSRARVPSQEAPSRTVVGWLFDFAQDNRDAFVVAMRARHGASGPARQAVEEGLAMIMADMRADLMASHRLPPLPEEVLVVALKVIVWHAFELCLACAEAPERRAALLLEAEQVFTWCLSGAAMALAGSPHPAVQGGR